VWSFHVLGFARAAVRRVGALAVPALLVAVVAGCGADGAATVDVRGTETAAPTVPAGPPVNGSGRPMIRPGTSEAEQRRLYDDYLDCLRQHGVPLTTGPDGEVSWAGSDARPADGSRPHAACGNRIPVLAPELDEARNPYYADDERNYFDCLVAHGMDWAKVNGEWEPGPRWGREPNSARVHDKCRAAAFDGKRG
jgi:hypothetical protein